MYLGRYFQQERISNETKEYQKIKYVQINKG